VSGAALSHHLAPIGVRPPGRWLKSAVRRADEREALGGEPDGSEPLLGHDRDTLDIERIATKFSRGGTRRKARG